MTKTNTTLAALPALPRMARQPKPKTNPCACGCPMLTAGRFVPGHDSRLRGWMLRLERGLETTGITPGELKAATAALKEAGGHVPAHGRRPVVAAVPNLSRKEAQVVA